MKSLHVIYSGGPYDAQESCVKPCSRISIGSHTKHGSYIYHYRYWGLTRSGKTIFSFFDMQWLPPVSRWRRFLFRLGLQSPVEVVV